MNLFRLFITTIWLISITEATNTFSEISSPTQQKLELRKGHTTSSSIDNHMPQLICTNLNEVDTSQLPDVVYCTDRGGRDKIGKPEWECEANLKEGLDFRTTKVTCEGYNDEENGTFHVLPTTCYLEYALRIAKGTTRTYTISRDAVLSHICHAEFPSTPKLYHECNEFKKKRMNK